jgi:hypothetical protein
MTLIIQKPTGAKLVFAKDFSFDPDAAAYIAAVETADTQTLETATRYAINNFVIGCKQDGIWNAIKASCILAGARTLDGALVPLVGPAPTKQNFVSGDYNRKTGIQGSTSASPGKYIETNVDNSDSAFGSQNSKHLSVFVSTTSANHTKSYIEGGNSRIGVQTGLSTTLSAAVNSSVFAATNLHALSDTQFPFMGVARNESSEFMVRARGFNSQSSGRPSGSPTASEYMLFANPTLTSFTNCKTAFYSIGESLDLALLDGRVTDLINAFGAAIP